MLRVLRGAAVIGVLVLVAACGTTAIESQTKTLDARQARLYFLRNTMTIGGVGAEIKVNGQKVGALANSSYFFVDRPLANTPSRSRLRSRPAASRQPFSSVRGPPIIWKWSSALSFSPSM
jgi:hypothetical protein